MYSPPLLNANTIARNGITTQLDAIPRRSILYVHAPAGCGKTTAIAQWLNNKTAAWISLDEFTSDPDNFFRGVLLALSANMADALPDPSFETFLDVLQSIREWPSALVIDDFHVCRDFSVLRSLPLIRSRMPVNTTFAVLSRNPPPAVLHDQIIKGVIRQITNLQFNKDEIISLFSKRGLFISKYDAESLYKQTDGWAAALSAILISGDGGYASIKNRETLHNYLRNNVFEYWEYYDDLKKCAICDAIHEDLCHVLARQPEVWSAITSLAEKTGLVTKLADGTFRFHALMRDFLENELRRDDQIDKQILYKKAAMWYMGKGDWLHTLDMATKTGDIATMEELSRIISEDYSKFRLDVDGYVSFVEKNLLPIPAHIIEKYPRLSGHCYLGALLSRCISDVYSWGDTIKKHADKELVRMSDRIAVAFQLAVDPRHSSWNVPKQFGRLAHTPSSGGIEVSALSLTYSFPYFHKGIRDYSDIAPELPEFLLEIEQNMAPVLGVIFKPLSALVQAGIYYERGQIVESNVIISEIVKAIDYFPPELAFTVLALQNEILRVQGKDMELEHIGMMIERTGAHDLSANYNAIATIAHLYKGDTASASAWLEQPGEDSVLRLYKIYQHLATARALMVTGKLSAAENILERLVSFTQSYRRYADYIEALTLLSICKWRINQTHEAIKTMLPALIKADELQFVMPVAKEGHDVIPLLQKVLNRLKYGYDADMLNKAFVNTLYMRAQNIASHTPGMFAEEKFKVIKLSPRQKEVLGYLEQNLSYKEISEIMQITIATVDDHIRKLHKKFEVSTTRELLQKTQDFGAFLCDNNNTRRPI